MRPYRFLCALAVFTVAVAVRPAAADEYCSVRPPKGATNAQLAELANISQPVAQQIALNRVQSDAGKVVQRAQLEIADGCLVWSFDLKVAEKPGLEEVQLDAGTGRVISIRHKSEQREPAKVAKEGARGKHSGQMPPK